MGRVSEKNPRYRTKDEIVQDLVCVLNSRLSYGAKWAVLRDAAWVWTEFDGKYKGCPYWTKKAREQYERDRDTRRLRHEHIVPRVLVIEKLIDLTSPTPERIREICDGYLIGVVVTLDEDRMLNQAYRRTMPAEFADPSSSDFNDPWLRYKRCNIVVVPTPTSCADPSTAEATA